MTGMERPVSFEPNRSVNLTVLVDDTIGEVYINDHLAMSTRMYDFHGGSWGVFVQQGSARFRDLACFSMRA
jgi:beta-fructofuranosidase